jgi:hypothetical protein
MSQVLMTSATDGMSDPVAWSGGSGLMCVGGVLDGADVVLLIESGGNWIEVCRTDEPKAVGFNAPAGSALRAAIMLAGTSTSVTVAVE